jgi:acetyl esterase
MDEKAVELRRAALCPGVAPLVTAAAQAFADAPGLEDVVGMRAAYEAFSARFHGPLPAALDVADTMLPVAAGGAVPVRVYRPARAGSAPAPCVIYLHGGGWVLGSPASHHGITADLADGAGVVVVSVDYRRAPEYPYPAAFDDSRAVVASLAGDGAAALGIDPTRIVVAGDSAGANLAAAVCLWARDHGGPVLAGQVLIYPVLGTDPTLPSYVENADGPLMTTADMRRYWQAYLGGPATTGDPYAAPLAARDPSRLPPALVTTAGYDPVRDDGLVYARRLAEAGGAVVVRNAADLPHGHLRARHASPSAGAEMAALIAWVRDALR